MRKESIRSVLNKAKTASAMARERGDKTSDRSVKYFLNPFLAKEFGELCSLNFFRYITSRVSSEKDSIENIKKKPKMVDYGIDKEDFILLSQNFVKARSVGIFLAIIIDVIFWVSLAGFVEGLILSIIPGFLLAGLAAPDFSPRIYCYFSPGSRKILKYTKDLIGYYKNDIDFWKNLSWRDFEKEVIKFFVELNFKCNGTPASGDKGVDGWISYKNKKIAIQCKKKSQPVGPAIVRELLGTMLREKADIGLIITTTGYSVGAHEAAGGLVILLDMEEFINMDRLAFEILFNRYIN